MGSTVRHLILDYMYVFGHADFWCKPQWQDASDWESESSGRSLVLKGRLCRLPTVIGQKIAKRKISLSVGGVSHSSHWTRLFLQSRQFQPFWSKALAFTWGQFCHATRQLPPSEHVGQGCTYGACRLTLLGARGSSCMRRVRCA